jgi:hypothetical protein
MRLPGVTGHPLSEVLTTGIIDPDVFHAGYAIMAARYEQLRLAVTHAAFPYVIVGRRTRGGWCRGQGVDDLDHDLGGEPGTG